MTFPVIWTVAGVPIHAHQVMEWLGYFLGYRLYIHLRQRRGDHLHDYRRLVVMVAAIAGAALGSKLLAWAEDPSVTAAHLADLSFLMTGKSVVGGLLGGLVTVELVKLAVGEREATGDLYALPLILGMAIGRVGCFLEGLPDYTYGVATSLPWGVNFGDGVYRHPTQLYEILFLGILAGFIIWRSRFPYRRGDLFKLFMAGYLGWRLFIDAFKPYTPVFVGLCSIQLACLAGLLYYAPRLPRLLVPRKGGVPVCQDP